MPCARGNPATSSLALFLIAALACCGEGAPGPDGTSGAGVGGAGGAGVGGAGGAGLLCEPWTKRPCYTGPPETEDIGACARGFSLCNAVGTDWSFCEGEITPSAEDCASAADDDCDGTANEGCARTPAPGSSRVGLGASRP